MLFLFNKPNLSTPQASQTAKNVPLYRILICGIGIAIVLFLIIHFTAPTNTNRYHSKLLDSMENANTFTDFTDALFRYEVTYDSVTTAYSIQNPNNWNIPSLEPSLTSFSYKKYLTQSTDNYPDKTIQFVKKCLADFSQKDLSEEEQLTYQLLTDYLDTSMELSQYSFYEGLLGSSSGVQANLPVTLGEYPLRTEADIKTYLELLTQIPTYFEDIISYEEHRSKLGYNQAPFVTANALTSTKTMVTGFHNGDNSFVDTFNERITQIDTLSKKEINNYKHINQQYVDKYVIPSYELLLTHLEETLNAFEEKPSSSNQTTSATNNNSSTTPKTTSQTTELTNNTYPTTTNQASNSTLTSATEINILSYMEENTSYGICQLPKGKEYYTLLTKQSTGSNRPISDLISMTDQALSNALGTVLNTALTDQKAYLYYCEHPLETYYESPEAILDNLALMAREDYPVLQNNPSYEIKMVSDSLASSLSPAFYMIPAIDDYQNNTIYINPLHTNEENGNLFPTLAHEGFPGHLYQTVYFNESNPSDIRQMLNYLGYVEGWATYVEIDSLTFLDYPSNDEALCKLYQAETIINLALCARIDLGVNYEGWTLRDTRAFFEEQGFNSYYAQDVYSYVVEAPTNYLSYFIGYLEIMDIKDAFRRQELENYSEKEFHKKLLDVGPADFETVRKYVLK